MGGVRELEQAAVCTLVAEFARLQSILCEDLTKSLSALHSELEASSEVLSADLLSILNLHPGDPAFPQVKELIHKHHQSVSMKVNLPLIELEVAREDLERFLQGHLCELSSDPGAWEVVEEISQTLLSYTRRVLETILVPGIEWPGVFNQVVLALAMDQPVEAILFPGILDGLSGRLSLMPPSVVDPPTKAREGVSQRWAAALREAVMKTEGREVNPDRVNPHVVHPGLHQDYNLEFQMRRVDDIAPTLTSPMLSGLISSFRLTGVPKVPKRPASPKVEEGLWSHGTAPAGPDTPGPSHIGGPGATEGNKPLEQGGIDLDATIPAFTSEDAAAVIISDDDETSFPAGWPEAVSTPKIELVWGQKQPLEDISCKEACHRRKSLPPHEAALPRRMSEEDILPKRYEVFTSDYDWVQSIRGSLLGLEAGTSPSRRDIDNSICFVPRMAASESDLPEVIIEHWLPIIRRKGLLMECPLDQFTTLADWIPLYTCEGLQKYLPAVLSAFLSLGTLSLIAVAPPEFHIGMDKEFLLCNFHHHQCLMRQSFNLKGRHRQLAFCPYCGVINENSDTALSHVRRHLDLQFICGGCYSKSFLNGPALNKHMRTQCPSVSAIRNCSRSSRR